jgi:hypothetical protein
MESTGVPNHIQVSQTTYDALKQDYLFEERGQQEVSIHYFSVSNRPKVKGKGKMVTYLYRGRLSEVNFLRSASKDDDTTLHTIECQ